MDQGWSVKTLKELVDTRGGFERLIRLVSGCDHVRDVIPTHNIIAINKCLVRKIVSHPQVVV